MKLWASIVACMIIAIGFVSAVDAQAPKRSLRPLIREQMLPPALPNFAPSKSLRPVTRPKGVNLTVEQKNISKSTANPAAKSAVVVTVPEKKTAKKTGLFSRTKKSSNTVGKVCKDRRLVGKEIKPVPGKLAGCGISKGAIKLYEVRGVRLSTPSIMTCETAKALELWVNKGLEPAMRSYGGGVVELKVAAHYSCRTRNNRKGAKISEHGKGKAIDLSEFRLRNGDTISVLKDWNNGKKGRILKKIQKSACGPFGTVLGPNADRYHKDHFHFDVARHRNGTYCR